MKIDNLYNSFNITEQQLNDFISFNIGKTNFYWEYMNGTPFCQKKQFTFEDLNNHLIGSKVFGFSPFIDNKTIMFAALDFDAHRDEDDTEETYQAKVVEAQEDAIKVYEYMKSYKLAVVLNSSGSEGRHVRWCCKGAPAANVRLYLQYVLYKLFGDPNKHEIFPKQDELSESTPCGNQIKGCLCVHPKHKKRANIMGGKVVLDFHNSLKVMNMALENLGNVPKFSDADVKLIQNLDKSHKYIEKYNNKDYIKDLQNIPEYCAFFEEVATKHSLPSDNKYSRHKCLDSNMAGYGITHPNTRIAYAEAQGRTSHTAFDNWPKKWKDGIPQFNCGLIIAYARTHSKKGNKNAHKGLKKCLSCPRFKEFMKSKIEPRGYAKGGTSIIKAAKYHNFTNCPICDTAFKFDDRLGWWECQKCNKKGGFIKFIHMMRDSK